MGDRKINEEKYWEDFRNGKDLAKYGDKPLKKWDASLTISEEMYTKRMQYENKYDQ